MNRSILRWIWLASLGLGSLWFTCSTRADDPKAETKRPRLVVQMGHGGVISSVAFALDGKQVLTGSADNTARLCDAQNGKELRTFTGHAGGVTSVAFAPDGNLVLTGSLYLIARLWDAQSGQELRAFMGHAAYDVSSVGFAPDGKQMLTGSSDDMARLWDAQIGMEFRTFTGHTFWVNSVAFAPKGKRVLDRQLGQDGAVVGRPERQGTPHLHGARLSN